MVANNWNMEDAAGYARAAGENPADQQLALQAYASRLIGRDPQLVQHGGGNTSCKVVRKDLFGRDIRVLHVKGSGHDLAFIDAAGMPGVRLDPLLALRDLDHLGDADMVNMVRSNLLDSGAPNPSVEILLHAYLPHAFINHTHATAMLALADLPDAVAAVAEIFGDTVVTVPFYMPGFALAQAAAEIYEANPQAEGLVLLNHGHFAFSDSPEKSYDLIVRHTNMVEAWLAAKSGKTPKRAGLATPEMLAKAADILPLLRGILGQRNAAFTADRDAPMPVMDLRAGPNVREFLARADVATLAGRGVATPDHVIRTKNYPLYLTAEMISGGEPDISQAIDTYTETYTAYFIRNAARAAEPKTMLNPAPDLAWIDGVGIVGIGADARAAGIAADLAEQGITAMTNGEDCGGFFPVAEEQLFDMEYWSLEQAKLGKAKRTELAGHV
ncbi:MAG: rhamnose utilization protein RhaD (predicted bifunctional aldolase and dehydrogenase), partial [Paracoccaceae bacterium]